MSMYRRFFVGLVIGLCFCLLTSPALAWEFSLAGEFNWRFFLFSQIGNDGFFGPHDVDNGAPNPGSASVVNFWHGRRLAFDQDGPDLVSGSDASGQYTYMVMNPQIRFNKAVRVRGRYRIGSWAFNTPVAGQGVGSLRRSEYLSSQALGAQRSFSPGYWELLWLSAQTPFGIISVGKRPGIMGCGLMFDGTDNFTVETISMVTNYGPFRFGCAVYPGRVGTGDYWNPLDKSGVRLFNGGAFVTYRVGPLDMGAQNIHVRIHRGPEAYLDPLNRTAGRIFDRVDNFGTSYVKYNNGRFFFNVEGSWYHRIQTRHAAPQYIEHWRAMTELGFIAGPLKTSLIWARITGPDRRHGILIDRDGDLTAGNPVGPRGNTSVFRPYSHIFVYTYGGGSNRFTEARNGYLTDANVFGARIDYAVVANLNVFGSFFHARRLSHGYGFGYIRPALDGANNPTGLVEYARQGGVTALAIAIPNNELGYEIDCGFNWQLLEGYTLTGLFGIWQPGNGSTSHA